MGETRRPLPPEPPPNRVAKDPGGGDGQLLVLLALVVLAYSGCFGV